MRITGLFTSAFLICLLASLRPAAAQTKWQTTKALHIGGEGGWDYLTVDPQTHRLYVPRSTHTMIIDSQSGKTIADIPGQKIAHGVAIVPDVGRGFITDGGGSGAVLIFDLKTNALLGTITAQPDADGIIYDQASRRVVLVSGDKGTLMTLKPDINPKNGSIDASIDLGGAPEFLASDGAGKIYVNLMDKNEVAVVDIDAKKVVARWPVAPGGAPVGMTIDTNKHRLFIGCRKPQKFIVMSTETGKVLADLPIGPGVDATKIDGNQAFASCGDGTLTVIAEQSPGNYHIVQVVQTRRGARTMGLDPSTHTIYLPTAEFEQPAGASGRPQQKPGTFMIVVVSPATS